MEISSFCIITETGISLEKGKILETRELEDRVEAVVVEASITKWNRNRRKMREFYLSIDTRIC